MFPAPGPTDHEDFNDSVSIKAGLKAIPAQTKECRANHNRASKSKPFSEMRNYMPWQRFVYILREQTKRREQGNLKRSGERGLKVIRTEMESPLSGCYWCSQSGLDVSASQCIIQEGDKCTQTACYLTRKLYSK